jgi:hypothetical protein
MAQELKYDHQYKIKEENYLNYCFPYELYIVICESGVHAFEDVIRICRE